MRGLMIQAPATTSVAISPGAMAGTRLTAATAEVAVVVAHNDHLRGVGRVLLRRLAQIARANGIQHLVVDILATNHLLFKVLHDAGLRPRGTGPGDGVVHIDIDLTEITSEPRVEIAITAPLRAGQRAHIK